MTASKGILVLVDNQALHTDIERVAAAAGLHVVRAVAPSSRKVWTSAAAILLDGPAALRCVQLGMPRRARVVLVGGDEPGPGEWQAAVAVGAQQVVTLPVHEHDLMAALADAADTVRDGGARGPIIAVLAGRGGAGASVFATALACTATESLLVDGDPWSGGLDLLLGVEHESGLRWPDLSLAGGRLDYRALRDALPGRHGARVLASGRVLSRGEASKRMRAEVDAVALGAVIDAGSRGGVTVICDAARRPAVSTEGAVAAADLVILITPADVRSCAAATATAQWAVAGNPNTGLVVRGPAPGGLRPDEAARIVGLPVLAAMRPQPGLDTQLERGGLRLRARSPLRQAARKVLAVVSQNPHLERAGELVA